MNELEEWRRGFLLELRDKYSSYSEMIHFCCDSWVPANTLFECLQERDLCFEEYCGAFCDEDGNYEEIFQYFLIEENDAERLAAYTNELVLYCEEADVYFLCVTHFGTAWSGVSANWKRSEVVSA